MSLYPQHKWKVVVYYVTSRYILYYLLSSQSLMSCAASVTTIDRDILPRLVLAGMLSIGIYP